MTPEQLAKNGTEDGHQAALFCKVTQNLDKYPELVWLHAIPNGGARNKVTAARMKATGTRAGVLDIFLPVPAGHPTTDKWHGLYIEMKKPEFANRKNGGLSEKQIEFKNHATFWGYAVAVCYSWEEAWNVIEHYCQFYVPEHARERYKQTMEQAKWQK